MRLYGILLRSGDCEGLACRSGIFVQNTVTLVALQNDASERVLVRYKPGAEGFQAAESLGLSLLKQVGRRRTQVYKITDGSSVESILDMLKELPGKHFRSSCIFVAIAAMYWCSEPEELYFPTVLQQRIFASLVSVQKFRSVELYGVLERLYFVIYHLQNFLFYVCI